MIEFQPPAHQDPAGRPSVAEQVFGQLQRQILSLDLEPGSKVSEAELAKALGVSRQPVRDAFFRLAKLGYLLIRPQRATTVTLISENAVLRARSIRTALEVETVRTAALTLSAESLDVLDDLIAQQDAAVRAEDKAEFHRLDDLFHHEICNGAGVGFFWELIAENKGHMDRVRMLSLSFASRDAWNDHVEIMRNLRAQDVEGASTAIRNHLSRILQQLDRIRAANHEWFAAEGE
ncbi:GntR family transcriptional regulator [Phaeobacter sp. HF9A]|uniref:GntR family transcriptional regulator n=1 Tax=Phaeobacter sp. HF9A TaxID=2721561 RepID=UPI0014317AA5|nr:GntR family transcriptional regulator [Phaeobacter sp. HF9A]NIZ12307.1 GntR family transcriptional regulator [Phaeobacter sp. HF9A]